MRNQAEIINSVYNIDRYEIAHNYEMKDIVCVNILVWLTFEINYDKLEKSGSKKPSFQWGSGALLPKPYF